MTLVPVKINDGSPRNSIGQLISVTEKYQVGISICNQHKFRPGMFSHNPDEPDQGMKADCRKCQADQRRVNRWHHYLQSELECAK